MGLRILVVDDEPNVTEYVKLELEDRGFEVVVENTGYEALQHVMQGDIDVMITDIAMPDMDGFELYRRSRELNDDLPIIMMTGFGYDPNHTVVKARKGGLQNVMFKPFDTDELVERINRITSEA